MSKALGRHADPTTSGEGFNLALIAPDRLVVSWYTYQPDGGGPEWIAADGAFDGTRFIASAFTLRGARFGVNLNSA